MCLRVGPGRKARSQLAVLEVSTVPVPGSTGPGSGICQLGRPRSGLQMFLATPRISDFTLSRYPLKWTQCPRTATRSPETTNPRIRVQTGTPIQPPSQCGRGNPVGASYCHFRAPNHSQEPSEMARGCTTLVLGSDCRAARGSPAPAPPPARWPPGKDISSASPHCTARPPAG